jgi:hypothetical protein
MDYNMVATITFANTNEEVHILYTMRSCSNVRCFIITSTKKKLDFDSLPINIVAPIIRLDNENVLK